MIVYPQIDPVAIAIGPLKVHWYGLMYLAGFTAAWLLANQRIKRIDAPLQAEQVSDLIFYAALGVVLGGRIGYVLFYNLPAFLADPLSIFAVWQGGMSFHGGLLGVLLAIWLFARKMDRHFFAITDFIAPLVPPGLGAGRIGNFIGGELWGRATDLPWAMVFPHDPAQLLRHPSQLYQAACEGVLLFALLWWFSSGKRPRGAVSGLFLLGYGLQRFMIEFVREPDVQIGFDLFGWLTRGQMLCLPMIIAGVLLLVMAYRLPETSPSSPR